VLTDFDGTLAPLVADPAAAVAAPGALEALERLAAKYALVGIVSGRPVAFLRRQLEGRASAGDLWLSGLYGLETFEDGHLVEAAAAGEWRSVVGAVTARAKARFGGRVEDKGLSLTLHFRTDPELADAIRAWAGQQAAVSGLVLRPAKASIELHPPVDADKGTVIEEIVGRRLGPAPRAVAFLGDDLGDLAGFDGLDRLAVRGAAVLKVAVATAETPAEVLARADLVVDGPTGAVALLDSL
jgi:trehalose 6-phosphate phosphatase